MLRCVQHGPTTLVEAPEQGSCDGATLIARLIRAGPTVGRASIVARNRPGGGDCLQPRTLVELLPLPFVKFKNTIRGYPYDSAVENHVAVGDGTRVEPASTSIAKKHRAVLSDALHPDARCFKSMCDLMKELGADGTGKCKPLPNARIGVPLLVCAAERFDGPMVENPDTMRSLVTNWLRGDQNRSRYLQMDTGRIRSTLQNSIVRRDGQFDIIVSNIEAKVERRGHGTDFMLALLDIAKSLQPPRGVQLEQVITLASRGLANRLCTTHNWRWSTDGLSVFSQ